MNNPRFLFAAALAVFCVACQPSAPPAPSVAAPVAPAKTPPVEPPHASPTAIVVPASTQFTAPAISGAAVEPLPVIPLPEGASLEIDAGKEMGLAVYAALKTPNALRFVYGAGTRRIVVFSDPGSLFDMAFFQMLEANADNLDATVTILPYAPPSRTGSSLKIQALFCAQSPERAWRSWMIAAQANTTSEFGAGGNIPEVAWQGWSRQGLTGDGTCSPADLARLDQIRSLGDRLSVQTTPTVVFAHGQAWPGPIVSREDLEKVWGYVYGYLKVQG